MALIVLSEVAIGDFLDEETCQAHPDRQREQNDRGNILILIDQEVYIEFIYLSCAICIIIVLDGTIKGLLVLAEPCLSWLVPLVPGLLLIYDACKEDVNHDYQKSCRVGDNLDDHEEVDNVFNLEIEYFISRLCLKCATHPLMKKYM